MPGSSNTSFIPKRNPAQKERQGAKRQVFVGTFIIRILFFASLIAAAGVFIYETQLKKALDAEIVALSGAIGTFNEAEMQRVLQTNARLSQAEQKFESAASVGAVLRALERAAAQSVQVTELSLERIDDTTYEVEANMKTETFDSTIFQRSLLDESGIFVVSEITDLVLVTPPPEGALYEVEVTEGEDTSGVSFKAVLTVATDAVPHTVTTQTTTPTPPPVALPVATTTEEVASSTDAATTNQDTL